jgi:hypothetical protein
MFISVLVFLFIFVFLACFLQLFLHSFLLSYFLVMCISSLTGDLFLRLPCMFFHVWYFCFLPNKELGLIWILDTVYVDWYPKPNLCGHVTFHDAIWRLEAHKSGHQVTRMDFVPFRLICVDPECGTWRLTLPSGRNLTTFRLTPLPLSS